MSLDAWFSPLHFLLCVHFPTRHLILPGGTQALQLKRSYAINHVRVASEPEKMNQTLFSQHERTAAVPPNSSERLLFQKKNYKTGKSLLLLCLANKQPQHRVQRALGRRLSQQWRKSVSPLMCALSAPLFSWRALYKNIMPWRQRPFGPSGLLLRMKYVVFSILIVHWN